MTQPKLLSIPFANIGEKNDIPDVVAAQPQQATMETGFPQITQTPIAEGGVPPERADFNGIFNIYGQHIVHLNKGLGYKFDSTFANKIGGYPKGASLILDDDITEVISEIDANLANPNVNMQGWTKKGDAKDVVTVIDSVNDIFNIAAWVGRTVYIPSSGHYRYINGVWKNVSVGYGGTVYLDDIVPSKDGTSDCAPAINAAIKKYSGDGVTIIGNPASKYLIRDTIDFNDTYNICLDFNFSTLVDDVQGTIGASGGRGKHTILIYNADSITVKKINYNVLSTRSNPVITGIPTMVFWVGGQYLGGAMTSNISIEDFRADGHSIDMGMVVSGVGELDGITLKRFSIKNGNWRWGCNFEYGLRPVDLEENLTLTNGRHPYNISVENFNGEHLPKCTGFLRTASCYNAKFFSCTGFNVPNFIDYYSGDMGISRYSQNVVFELCKSKLDDTVTIANYGVNIVVTTKDGSTQEPLEAWVNRDHVVKFSMCEFIGNYTQNSTAVRFVGNAGKTIFEGCTFQRYYYGAWSQWLPTTNPNLDSPYSLVFRDCIFKKNKGDIRQIDVSGVLYDHCTFKNKIIDSNVPYQIGVFKLNGNCEGTVFKDCLISDQPSSLTAMRIESDGVSLESNTFKVFNNTTAAISTTAATKGFNNRTNGLLTGDEQSVFRIIGDTKKIKVFTNVGATNSVNFNSSSIWVINSTQTIEQIIGGEIGDIVDFRAGASTCNATFVFNSSNATTQTRLINKSVANDNIIGLTMSRRYMKFSDGWREM